MQRYLVQVTGKGIVGVQHRTGLEAALARPLQVGFGTELYPTVPDKIAALVHSIITTHVFVDANKRTAMALGLALAEANGQLIHAIGDQEIEDVAVGIATHVFDVSDITEWFKSHYEF